MNIQNYLQIPTYYINLLAEKKRIGYYWMIWTSSVYLICQRMDQN